jgi:DNA polymerase-1
LTKLLIDVDIMAYRCSFSNEVATETEDGYWTWYCSLDKVKEDIEKSIQYFMKTLDADSYVLCLSDEKNFRKDIYQGYKEKRARVKRPIVLRPIREWLLKERGAVMYPSLEGDDVMGILQTDDTIIVSLDKDMRTIPGRFYRDGTMFNSTKEEAQWHHYFQTLSGDSSDGYPGCPQIGPKKAEKLLEKPSWKTIVETYEKAGLTEEDALVQAQCAKILTKEYYNVETGEITLWTPKEEV